MTLTPQEQNQNESHNNVLHVMFGSFAASVKDHKTLFLIISLVLAALFLFLLNPEKIKDFIDRKFVAQEAWQQYDLYAEQQKSVSKVIKQWNNIKSIDDTHTLKVKDIRARIKGVLNRFKNLDITALPRINQALWNHDLARLYNIQFDITKNEKYLEKAIEHLKVADKISSGDVTPKLTKDEITFFEENKISHEIQWTFLASYAINSAFGSSKYDSELKDLKVYFGGCRMLLDQSLQHQRMLQGIGCNS